MITSLCLSKNGNGNFRYFFYEPTWKSDSISQAHGKQAFERTYDFVRFFRSVFWAGASLNHLSYLMVLSNGTDLFPFIIVRQKDAPSFDNGLICQMAGIKECAFPFCLGSEDAMRDYLLPTFLYVRPIMALSLLSWLIPI